MTVAGGLGSTEQPYSGGGGGGFIIIEAVEVSLPLASVYVNGGDASGPDSACLGGSSGVYMVGTNGTCFHMLKHTASGVIMVHLYPRFPCL